MAISNDWFIDYYNQLFIHTNIAVYYTGTGGFTIGETVTWVGGNSAIVVAEDATNDILFITRNTDTPAAANVLTGSTSSATCTTTTTDNLNIATMYYDGGAGGWVIGERVTFGGSTEGTVVSDDTTNDILVVEYMDGTISDNDAITVGTGTGNVNGTPTVSKATYTVRQLYSFVQDTFDELIQMDDTVPMSAQTPTEFTLINNWFIDDESTKYLSGGAISTSSWDGDSNANGIRVLSFDAGGSWVDAIPTDIGKGVTETGGSGDTGTLLAYDNTLRKWWVRQDSTDDVFTSGQVASITAGTGTGDLSANGDTGEHLWANIYTLGTIQTTPNPVTYIFQSSTALSEWWGRGDSESHIDVLIKVQDEDGLIDSGTITVFARQYADQYDHFPITVATGGRNAVPLATQEDLNNNTNGEATLALTSGTGFIVGNFIRGATSLAYAEILVVDGNTLTVGNIVGDYNAGTPASPAAFSNGETVYETIDGTSNGDTGDNTTLTAAQTNVVAGYNDIAVVFVNQTLSFNSGGTATPTVGATLTDQTGASGIILEYNVTSGTWAGGDAAGTFTIGNWNGTAWTDTENLDQTNPASANIASVNQASDTYTTDLNKAFEQGTAYPYNVIVDCAGRTMSQVYEWFKYVTREDANSNQTNYQTMYRINDAGDAVIQEDGEEYIYAQTTYTPSKASPFGTFAGGKLFAARGVWVENMDAADRQNFQLIDANGTTRVPPNFITITVNSVSLGDKVSVFRTESANSTDIDKDQFAAAGLTNTSGATSFVVSTSIPSDTPSSGYVRIIDTADTSINRESRYSYSSWTGSTFTLSGSETLDRTYSAGLDTAYVPYYDEVAYPAVSSVNVTVIYTADQSVLTRVRQYDNATPSNSILPFQITGSVGSSGYTVAAIRTADTIVTSYP